MDFDRYTERARGVVQAAQTQAVSRHHQRLTPEHILKVLLEDREGLCAGLIQAAGGDPRAALERTESVLDKLPRVEGGNDQLYMTNEASRLLTAAQEAAEKAGDSYVTVERLLLGATLAKGSEAADVLKASGVTPQSLNAAIEALRKGRTADTASAEQAYDALKRYATDLTGQAESGKLDPVIGRDEEIPPHHPGAGQAHQEQPGPDRRAWRRQDGDRRGPCPADRQRRRARTAPRQAADGARPRRDGRRRQVSGRVRGTAEGGT